MPRVKTSGIYAIRNTRNGKVYVGKSVDLADRWRHHRRKLQLRTHVNPHLQAAWNLDGPEGFVFEVLEEAPGTDLPGLEQKWMVQLGSCSREKGYNLDLTTPTGKAMSPETRAKIGAANRGKVRSPEMRAHMRAVKKGQGKGRVKTPQELEHLRDAHRRRASETEGYTWFRSIEGRTILSAAGKRGASARWNPEDEG